MLDLIRWISALLVAVGHLRNLLFLDFGDLDHPAPAVGLFYFVTGFGHEAVIIFFVLSGYLVGGKLLLDGVGTGSLLDYFAHRFSRIYLVLAPALVLTAALDFIGAHLPAGAPLYAEAGWAAAVDFVTTGRGGAGIFLCNLVNLQDAFCPAYGSDSPLWSLAYEWFYYVTFPALLILLLRIGRGAVRRHETPLWLGAIAAAVYIFPNYASLYPIWLLGVAARFAMLRSRLPKSWLYGAAMLLVLALCGGRYHLYPPSVASFLIGGALALLLANPHRPRFGIGQERLHGFMAGFSYSLYVVHFPCIMALVASLRQGGAIDGRLTPGLAAVALFVACLAVIYATACGFSLLTERHTNALRRLIAARVLSRFQGERGVP